MCIQAGELFNLMGLEIGRLRALTLSPTHTVPSAWMGNQWDTL